MKSFHVYILASKRNGALYTGITSDLPRRVWEHREGVADGHTSRKSIKRLVYFETFSDPENAILREKKLKKWRRQWKIDLIEQGNPDWNDLYKKIQC